MWVLVVFSIHPRELFHIVINKSQSIGRAMVAIIMLLYITTTINFSLNFWVLGRCFKGGPYYEYRDLFNLVRKIRMPNMGIGITAVMSTVVADSAMVCENFLANCNINLVLI